MEKGKMIINGVEVGGSFGSATSVPYSNTNSGLEATNVQGAIDELNSNLNQDMLTVKNKTLNVTLSSGNVKITDLGIEEWQFVNAYIIKNDAITYWLMPIAHQGKKSLRGVNVNNMTALSSGTYEVLLYYMDYLH